MSLPTGTVTFLFTDIEGSTRLAREYRAAWEGLRARHHAILREAVDAYDGYVFQVVGDAFCAAFSTAGQAVRAAVKAQVELASEAWPDDTGIRVRMGLHTGRAELQANGEYLGYLAMSRVQRLMSAAHGGQVLLSLAAQELIQDDVPEGVALRDLGEHRLKDIPRPERIFQLVVPGLSAEFPPLKTLENLERRPREGLAVKLLGAFEIRFDNRPILLSSRIAQSLFAFLILHAGTSFRREKLAGLFWPDAPEARARAYLRHELWRIRKALPSPEFLLVSDIGISLDSSADYWLDAKLVGNLRDTASADELIAGLSAAEGELLPGFYDEWILPAREHLQAVYEQKMARLLELLESEKRWNEVLEWAERWISSGPSPEAAYRSLMIAYDALGDRARVASTYQRCAQALRELDLEPSEATRSLAFKRTSRLSIPIPLTSFIGREKELEEVASLLSRARLVTLTGSGGVGKTRLAIQVVVNVLEYFPDGVWFVDLAPLNDPALVSGALAGVLDLNGGSDQPMTDRIAGYLRSRKALIIVDNCEHLIEACAHLVESLLSSCNNIQILATSREVLRVSGEVPYRVPSLGIPGLDRESGAHSLAEAESVRLFIERAAVVSRGFAAGSQNMPVVAGICQRLDGIPLAIELAAARTNVLAVEQILERLDDRFNLLTGGLRTAVPRHQTLRATIEWSYDLLLEKERLLFQRLAVFKGGWTLSAAEEVCRGKGIEAREVLDLLTQLVDKSLVLVETSRTGESHPSPAGSTRYRRLETIRQFGCEKLAESGEEEQIRAVHLEYFLRLAQKAEVERHSGEMVEWLQRLEDEHGNMRAALEWSLQGNVSAGQQLAGALAWWWEGHHPIEGYEWLQTMLAVNEETETKIRAKLLAEAGWIAAILDYSERSIALSEESLALYRQLDDKKGMAYTLAILGTRAFVRSDYDRAAALLQESRALYRGAGDKPGIAWVLIGSGYTAEAQGDFEQAERFYEESLVLCKELGTDGPFYFMGNLAASQGDDARAMALYEEALRIQRVVKNKNLTSWILNEMGMISIRGHEYEKAILLLQEGLEAGRKTGKPGDMAYSLYGLAMAARLQGEFAQARLLYTESLQLVQPLHLEHDVNMAEFLLGVAHLVADEGLSERFACMLGAAEGVAPHIQTIISQFLRVETGKCMEMARAALGDEAYTAAWETGRRMSLDEAISCALKELQ